MIRRFREKYVDTVVSQTPNDGATSSLARLQARAVGIAVMVVLDVNDWVIRRFVASYASVRSTDEFEWSGRFQAAWKQIRDEYLAFAAAHEIPLTTQINGLDTGDDAPPASVPLGRGNWRSLVLSWFGSEITETARHFPVTMGLFESASDVLTIGFSVVEPNTHIAAHCDPNRGSLRYQLPIVVPGPTGSCRIRVGQTVHAWTEGEAFVFDLATEHEVFNDSDDIRVLLMIEVIAPLPGIANVSNRLAQRAYRHMPTYQSLVGRVSDLAREGEIAQMQGRS